MFIVMIIFLLLAIIYSILLKFPQFKILKNLKKKKSKKTRRTFWLGLATNLGVGNLIGVSSAIYFGGPGVIFWMAIFAFFASSFAYSETYNAITAQVVIEGEKRSSTSFVILKHFKGKIGVILASIFALFLVFTNSIFFPPIQIHAVVNTFDNKEKMLIAFILIIFIIIITSKGINNITKFTDIVMPITAVSFTICICFMILINYKTLPTALNQILGDAFKVKSFTTASFFTTIQIGISKSLFSHEAGLGTMPSLVGISEKSDIIEISYYQVLSVIVDTVILCTLTGIFIIQSTNGQINGDVSLILSNCFYNVLGKNGLVISKIFVVVFGVSSIIGQYYLGETNAVFFSIFNNKAVKMVKKVFMICFYLGLILGIFLSFQTINKILDFGMVVLGLINIFVLFSIYFKTKKVHKNT